MQQSENSASGNSGDYRSDKGTGMSSESGSAQSEKSWQGPAGSQQSGSVNINYDDNGNANNNSHQNVALWTIQKFLGIF